MSDLSPPPINSPLIDLRTGHVTRPWLQWFAASFVRVGGPSALTNTTLETFVITLHEEPNDPFGGSMAGDPFGSVQSIAASVDPFGPLVRPYPEYDTDTDTAMLLARITVLEQRISTLEALEGFA